MSPLQDKVALVTGAGGERGIGSGLWGIVQPIERMANAFSSAFSAKVSMRTNSGS